MSLKMNLRGGVASLAQFTGIGQGLAQPKPKAKVEPFTTIGGAKKPKAKAANHQAEAGDDEMMQPNDGDDSGDDTGDNDGEDDQALDDDDYGSDAPDDNDSPEDAEAKRARRVARRARRLKSTPPEGDDENPPPAPPAPDETSDDDDTDSEMRGQGPMAKARLRERARCAAIFAHPKAAENPDLAAHLAFNTRMTRIEAVGALARGGATKAGSVLNNLMRNHAGHRPGSAPGALNPQQSLMKSVDAAFAEAAASRSKKK